jgi:glucosyl-dolichyl phosphate glucuronosyltransferase
MPMDPLFTLVVCTHSRPGELAECLESIDALEAPIEVLVVDSASEPPIADVVARFPGVRYVREEQPGLSRARNRGIAESSCELVGFLDDDAVVCPGWAEALAAPFTDRRVAAVGGAILPAFETARPRWLSDKVLQFASITNFRERKEVRRSHEFPFGANVLFRRNALERTSQFSEELGRTGVGLLSGEETAVIRELLAAGFRVVVEPAAQVVHPVPPERCEKRWYWRRLWWSGIGRGRGPGRWWLALRLTVALPIRLVLLAATRDYVYLFRVAETAGFYRELLRGGRTA